MRTASLAVAIAFAAFGCAGSAVPAPHPTAVTPDRGPASGTVALVIAGDFAASTTTDFEARDPSTLDARFGALLGAVPLLDVRLRADGSLGATVPAGIPVGTYDLTVVGPDGRVGTLAAAYRALADANAAPLVARYRIEPIAPRTAWAPFGVTITALDAAGGTVTAFNGSVALSDLTGTAVPGALGLFRGGQWSGTVEVRSSHAADVLRVADALGNGGESGPFAVAPTPPASLRFSTPPRATVAGDCSGTAQPLTVELVDAFGLPTAAAAPLALSAIAAPGLDLFADPACAASIGGPTIAVGAGSTTFWCRSTRAGSAALTVAGPSLTAASQVLTVTAAGPSKVAFLTAPQTVAAGDCSLTSTIEVRDAWDNPALGSAVSIALAPLPGAGLEFFANATCATPATSAVAAVPATAHADLWFRGTIAQPVSVVASGSGLSAASQTQLVTSQANPSRLTFVTPSRTSAAGGCSDDVTVQAQDVYGNPVTVATPLPIALGAAPANGFAFFADAGCTQPLAGAASVAAGRSSVTLHFSGTAATSETVSASAAGLTGASQAEVVGPAAPWRVAFDSAPLSAPAGTCSAAVALRLRDRFDNVATAAAPIAVSIAAPTGSGLALYADATCATPAAAVSVGVGASGASFYFKGSATGSFTLTASAPPLGAATQAEVITPALADHLVFTTASLSVAAGACSAAVSVQAADPFGNVSPIAAGASVALSSSAAAGFTFHSTSDCATAPVAAATLPPGGSVATFYFRATVAEGVTVAVASTSPVLAGATQGEQVIPAAPDHLVFTTGSRSITAGDCSAAVTVEVRDAFGNVSAVAAGASVDLTSSAVSGLTFHAASGCGSAPVASVNVPPGASQATFFFSATVAGNVTVTAASGAPVLGGASQDETVTSAAATHLGWAPIGSPQYRGRAFPAVVSALDAWGNVDTAFAGTATLSLAGYSSPTFTCAGGCTIAFASGVATGTVTLESPVSLTGSARPALVAAAGTMTAESARFDLIWVPARSPPTARVSADPAVTWVGQPVTFDASASSDYQTATADLLVSWDFDGTAASEPPAAPWSAWSTTKQAVHTWSTAGTRRARVAVLDSDGSRSYADVTVIVLASATAGLCLVDTTSDVDDAGAVTTCAAAKGVGDGLLSLPEALRLAVSGDTVAFARPMSFGPGAALSVKSNVTISGYGTAIAGRALSLGSTAGCTLLGLELAGLSAKVSVVNGTSATLRDVYLHDGPGLVVAGSVTVERVRMVNCAGGPCIQMTDASGQDLITARYSRFEGTGAGVAVDVFQCLTNKPALLAQSNVFHGWTTAISLECGGSTQVVQNTFDANGTGVTYSTGSSGHVLRNNVFTANGAAVSCGSAGIAHSYNLLWGNTAPGCVAGETGSLTADPLYVFPADGDWHLQLGSPAIDSPNNLGLNLLSSFPAPSGVRFLGGGPDLGGLESY